MNSPVAPASVAAVRYTSVLFIDAGVPDAAQLAAGAAAGVRVVMLDAGSDGVRQIAAALQGEHDLDSIQIISHGATGQVTLGSTTLDSDNVAGYQDALASWGKALSPDGDLLLYGCDVGRGSAGLAFVDSLADATGADVAASTDITGSAALGGNWTLERQSGSIEAASDLTAATELAYEHTLGLVNGGAAGTINFDTASTVTLLNATGLSSGAVVHADNILGLGLDVYAQSANGGSLTVTDVPTVSVIGLPLQSSHLAVNGSLLNWASYVDLRANAGVFDMVSLKLGGTILTSLLNTVVYTVYALDGNYQPTGVGVSLTSLVINEYGLLNFDSMANFKGIYGVRIVNPLGLEVDIDDVQVANGRIAPSISSAAYNAGNGVLSVAGLGLTTGDVIDPTKLTLTGEGGATYTLTTPTATVGGATAFTVTLNAADKLAVNGLLNKGGAVSATGASFALSAAAHWDGVSAADVGVNPVTVSNVVLPTITSATYDAVNHVLTVTGTNLVGTPGALNDIIANKFTLTGEGGVSRVLSTSGNVEVTSANAFSLTLSGADAAAVNAILAKNGSISASGTTYNLSAGDDWNGVIGGVNTAVTTAGVTVSNAQNYAPTLSGAAAGSATDKTTISPFANVTVGDVNGDNVSVTITYAAANGTLSGTGLTGSAGSYTLSAASAATLTARLDALVFTPTANQVAPGATVATTFTLTPTDSNGLAGTSSNATVVTTTSVNDTPVVSGAVAGQGVLAGSATLHPFAAMSVIDPDVGASLSASIVLDSASKGSFTAASLAASGFSTSDGGLTYTHAAGTPAALQTALQALVYQPAGGQNLTTTFTVNLNDGSATSSNSTTTVIATTAPTTAVTGVHFSNDSGVSATDLNTNVAAQTVSGTLGANLAAGEHIEVSLNNGATWSNATASVGSNTWSLAGQTLVSSDTLQVRVVNAAGSGTALAVAYVYDTTPPASTGAGVVFSSDSGSSASDLVTNVAAQNLSGTLSASLASGEHVEVSLDNGAHWSTATGAVGSNAWALAGQTLAGSNTLQVRVVDLAGNAGTAQTQAYVLDNNGPTLSISSNASTLKNGEVATFTFTFNEAPAGFTLSDINALNGSFANLTATNDPRVYTAQYTPNAGLLGVVEVVSVSAGSYTDVAGNSGGGALALGVTINTLGPSVVVTSDTATLKSGQTANITFTFSAPTSDFTATDVSVSGGTLSGFAATGNPAVYTAVFTPTAGVNNGSASITVNSGSYTDANTHNVGGGSLSPVIAIDTAAPTLAITSNLAAVHTGDVATITFTFSELPLGFTSGDVAVTGGTLSGFAVTANPLIYTAQFTPAAGQASGNASISVAAGSYTDVAGNAGLSGPTPAISIDTLPPSITSTAVLFSSDTGVSATDLVTRTAAQTISGSLSGTLGVGERVEVSLDNGAHWVNATAVQGATTWTLAGQTLTGSNTLQVRVTDAVGNHGAASSSLYVLDTTAPTLSITSDASALINGQAATITFTFSEAPQGFASTDIVAGGGVVSNLTQTADPTVWTATFTPTAGASGISGTVSVAAGTYTDTAGNGGTAAAMTPLSVNTLLPTLAITSDLAALKAGEVAHLTFTFNEVPVGFTLGDVQVAGGTLSGFAASANPLVYTAIFTPTAGVNAGGATISVLAGAFNDAAGNNGGAAVGPSITIDTQAPTLAITSDSAALKSGETAHITFTFSEVPSGFTQSDVQVAGGTLSGFAVSAGDSHVYTALFTPTPNTNGGVATISVAAGAYTDAAGNAGGAGAPPTLNFDTHTPITTNTAVFFSADNGSSNTDLVTNTAAQTVSGILGASLVAGEVVEVSIDNGITWVAASGAVGSTAWSLAGQTLLGSDVLQVRVSDTAGNHGAAFSAAYVLDLVAPTVAIGSSAASLNGAQTAQITFTFSEAPVGFTLADIDATGGSMSGLTATANPLVYTATFTPDAGNAGSVAAISLAAGSFTDNAGNAGVAGAAPAITLDTLAPTTTGGTVGFSNDTGPSSSDLVTNTASQDITGTLSANLASGEQVEVSLDNGAHWQLASATVGAAGWSLAGQVLSGSGTLLVRVNDAAGNHGLATASAYALDTAAPSMVMTSSMNHLNSADSAVITFTFSEAPQDFTAADVTYSGGTLTGFTATANPNVYTVVFTPTAGVASGSASFGVAAGSYTDLAGNAGAGAAPLTLSYQTVAPGVAISSNAAALAAGQTATISFTFSSAPSGFTDADVSVSGGTLSGLAATANPLVFTAQFTPDAGVAGADAVISIAAGSYTDALNNVGTAATAPAIHIDTVAPTLAITSNLASLKAGDTATITFTFSEAPLGFSAADVSTSGGTLSNLAASADPLVWTATLTPAAGVAGGSAQISVAAGAYTDAVGNAGVSGTSPSLAVHTQAPAITGATVAFSADNGASSTDLVTNAALQNISGTLNGTLALGEVVEVSLDNGAHWLTATTLPGGASWLLAGQTLSSSNTLQVRVTDGAGNHGTPFSSAYVLDTAAPTVQIASSAASLKGGETAVITFTFSEAPADFTLADLVVTGGTLAALSAGANPLVWHAVLTPTDGVNGSASVSLLPGLFTDTAGNLGGGATSGGIAVHTLAPAMVITSDVAAVKAGETALITFTFSQAPIGFTASDVSASGGTLSGFATTSNPRVYTAHFTPDTGLDGASASISVAAGAYTDATGNTGAAASLSSLLVDTVAPVTAIGAVLFSNDHGASATDLVTNAAAQTVSGTLGATLVAGEIVEVSLDNGAHWTAASAAVGSAAWSLAGQTLTGSNTLQVRVSDAAGNHGPAFSHAYVLDTTAPTMTIASNAATLNGTQSATLTFTFSEAPSGFTVGDINATGGTVSALTPTLNPLVYTALFSPTAGFSGNAGVSVAAGAYTDLAGNAGTAAASGAISLDATAPTLLITSNSAALKSGEATTVTFTFSEAPVGFTSGDVSVANGTLSGFAASANPLVYTATFTPAAGLNGVLAGVSVAAGSYTDAAGNPGQGGLSPVISIDTQAPTLLAGAVAFSNDTGINGDLITSVAAQTVSGTLNGALTAGDVVEVSFDNGAHWTAAAAASGGTTWSLAGQTLSGIGAVQVRVTDGAGNHGLVSSTPYIIDTAAPTMTMTSNAAALKAGQSATLTFTFSEAPLGFTVGDLVASNGALSGFAATANPLVYTALFTPTAGLTSGTASVSLAAGLYNDVAGNLGGAVSGPSIVIDTLAPTLTISSSSAALKAGETAVLTFTFSEAPVGFSNSDLAVSGGSLGTLAATANPLVYTAVFTPTAGISGGVASIGVAAGSYADLAGNGGGAATLPGIALETLVPVQLVTGVHFSDDTGVSNSDLITKVAAQTVSGTLSAPLTNGQIVEVSLNNGASWSPATTTTTGGVTTFSLAGQTLSGSDVLQVRVTDSIGNHGVASHNAYSVETATPTVAITSNAAALKVGETATLTFTFSEAPQGFTVGDLAVTNGTLGALTPTANPLVYTAVFTPTTGLTGAVAGVTLASGSFTDLAGNDGASGALGGAISINTQAPTTTASAPVFSADSGSNGGDFITNVAAQTVSGTLNVPLLSGETVQVSFDDGATWINSSATTGATGWSVSGTALQGTHSLRIRIADTVGNAGPVTSISYTLDTVAPTVAISSSRATVLTAQNAVITFTLSDPATLTLADIAVTGGTLSNLVHGSGNNYTAVFTPTANSTAAASISIAGHTITDAAGNSNLAASLPLAVDTTGPAAPTGPTTPVGTPSTVDGVTITTTQTANTHTGMAEQTVAVPTITATRVEDGSTQHATLADIPLSIAANGSGVASTLVISMPVGTGLTASGAASLLTQTQASVDLLGRLSDNVSAGATLSDLQQHVRSFLAGVSGGTMLHAKSLAFTGGSATPILVHGDATDQGSATALVLNTTKLGAGSILHLDDVGFAAVVGAANIQGGAGQNYIVGDDAVQHIVLTTGSDNDSVFAGGGDDIVGAAAGNDRLDGGSGNDMVFGGGGNDVVSGGTGNDVLQGGRSDVGQWQFYLTADGQVVGQHQMAMTDATSMESVTSGDLNTAVAQLGFAGTSAQNLHALSLFYHSAYDRAPDLGGLSYWATGGLSLDQVVQGFFDSPEAQASLTHLNNADFVQQLYHNSFGRTADATELAYWQNILDAAPGNVATRVQVFEGIALSVEHQGDWQTSAGVALGGSNVAQEQGWIAHSGDDSLEGGSGNNVLVGGDGTDTAVYADAAASHGLSLSAAGDVSIMGQAGQSDVVRQMELGSFSDGTVDIAFTQAAPSTLEQVGMMYHLLLGRSGDLGGFRYWVDSAQTGVSLADSFLNSPEFIQRFSGLDNTTFIQQIYQNAEQHAASADDLQQWQSYLGQHTRAEMLAAMSTDVQLVGAQMGTQGISLVGSLS
jgi:hypothetical protein